MFLPNIDWLQINCRCKSKPKYPKGLKVDPVPYGTRHFSEIVELKNKKGRVLYTVASKPHTASVLPKDMYLIKLDNSLLYNGCVYDTVTEFLSNSNLEFKSITRLDVCLDFHVFTNYWTIQNFIDNFAKGLIIKNQQGTGKLVFSNKQGIVWESLYFGRATSPRMLTIYNKSKEQRDVKMKYHILKAWRTCDDYISTQDVSRLEFRINEPGKQNIVDIDTGDVLQINSLEILKSENFIKLLKTLLSTDFKFYSKHDKAKNVSRKKIINFFPLSFSNSDLKLVYNKNGTDRTKSDKVYLKALMNHTNEYRERKNEDEAFRSAMLEDELLRFAGKKELLDYLQNKLGYTIKGRTIEPKILAKKKAKLLKGEYSPKRNTIQLINKKQTAQEILDEYYQSKNESTT